MNWPFQSGEANQDQLAAFLQLGDHPLTESRHLEFKSELDIDGIEVARDLSSLANGGGGLILYGVTTEDGKAIGIPGLERPEADYQRLDNLVRERCDLPPSYKPFFAQAEQAGRKVLVIQVAPELAHLSFVREELRSPAKFSCYIRTGPGKGQALSATQIRHELLRRLDYQERREILIRELEKNHYRPTGGGSVRIGVSFSPDLPQGVSQRLESKSMKTIERAVRESRLNASRSRSSLVPMPWTIGRVLEGLSVSSIRKDSERPAAFALTDSGCLTTEHFVDTVRLEKNSLFEYNIFLDDGRTCLNFDPVLEIFQEIDFLVGALRSNELLPSSGTWKLHIVMPQPLYSIRYWAVPGNGRRCALSPMPFKSLFARDDPWRIASIDEPFPASSFREVATYLLTSLAGGFGFPTIPGPAPTLPDPLPE